VDDDSGANTTKRNNYQPESSVATTKTLYDTTHTNNEVSELLDNSQNNYSSSSDEVSYITNFTNTILKECGFISGGRGSGKSRLGMLLTNILLANGVMVKVMDSSRQWLKHSSVPTYYTIPIPKYGGYIAYWDLPNLWNTIYDCSRLSTIELTELVKGMMKEDFQEAVTLDEQGTPQRACYIFEESQNLIPSGSLRRNDYQEVNRFVTQGRNYGLSYIAITQRLATTDTTLVELSGVKFFGKVEGENTVRKAKAWVNKKLLETSRDFPVGRFIVQHGTYAKIEQFPCFETLHKPQRYIEPKPEKKGFWSRIFG